ncbi:MAG: Lipid export ATP-binding/permease protein MsbA [Oscillospiraceae bacterium]|nr:Lipid export ATP-binding/permease protein MsbA [Oscillospiraceae bacterium]
MFKKIAKFMKGYELAAALGPILVILEVICELLLPLLVARIIDIGIEGNAGMTYILEMGAIMVAISILSMFSGVMAAKYASIASQGFGANLRKGLFDHVQEFSFADIDRFSSASLITRMTNDVNTMQTTVNMGLRVITRAPFMLISAVIVCFSLNAQLTLMLVVVIVVMAVSIGLLMKVCGKLFTIFQQKMDGLNDTIQENLIAIRVVKAFVRSDYEKGKFKRANDALTDAGIRAVSRIILQQPIMMLAMNAAIVGVLWMGGNGVMSGTMAVGDLSAFVTYISQILMSVMMVAMSLMMMTRSMACVRRTVEVLDTVPDIANGGESQGRELPAPRGLVEFRDASFKYLATGTGDDVLSHISFRVEPGQFVAVIGGTGVGKSSLVNLIPRFYDVTGGAVLMDGLDVRQYPLEALRGRIGMVLQNNILFSGTIRENLLWGKEDATEDELIQAIRDAQAYDFIMSFPEGLDTYIDQGGVNVSGGQKQRLCIARAMLRKPALLILDDSTSAVDSATEAGIRESFRNHLKDTTVLIIAQRISSVQYADKIIILDDDHIAGEGTHDELLVENPIYQEIYQSQQEGVAQ